MADSLGRFIEDTFLYLGDVSIKFKVESRCQGHGQRWEVAQRSVVPEVVVELEESVGSARTAHSVVKEVCAASLLWMRA